MIKTAKIMVIITMLLMVQNALAVDLGQSDKQKHIAVSTAISSTIKSYTGNNSYAFVGCLATGAMKEVYDSTQDNNRFDEEDMLANLIGCGVGLPIGTLGNKVLFNGQSLKFTWRF